MTTDQLMMRLREIETHLNNTQTTARSRFRLRVAQTLLCDLIEQMLADERLAG